MGKLTQQKKIILTEIQKYYKSLFKSAKVTLPGKYNTLDVNKLPKTEKNRTR